MYVRAYVKTKHNTTKNYINKKKRWEESDLTIYSSANCQLGRIHGKHEQRLLAQLAAEPNANEPKGQ